MILNGIKKKRVYAKMLSYLNAKNTIHICPQKGKWAIRKENKNRASKILSSKQLAIKYGIYLAEKLSYNLVLHKENGTFDCIIIKN